MNITGSYQSYLNMTTLLAPLGVPNSSNYIMQVFSSSMADLQEKLNQQVFSEESTEALSELYSQVSKLSSLAGNLTTTDTNSVFNDLTALSSDSSVLTATAWDAYSQDTGATETTYEISVSRIAQAQENRSAELNSINESVVDLGLNTFDININGQNHELNIEVEDGDTNEDVLNKISTAINEADLGVTAKIFNNDGMLNLSLGADDTGMAASFSVSDVSGNAIAATALDTISTEAMDAVYSVDGEGRSSVTNTVYLDDGAVTVSLQGAGDATLAIVPDEAGVHDAVTSLVSRINSLINFYNENSDYIKEDVLSSLKNILADHKTDLGSIGVTIGDGFTLQVDVDDLTSTLNQDPLAVKDIFTGFNGLAVEINSFTSRVSSDSPLNYAKEADSFSEDFTDFIYDSSASRLKQLLAGSLLNMHV